MSELDRCRNSLLLRQVADSLALTTNRQLADSQKSQQKAISRTMNSDTFATLEV